MPAPRILNVVIGPMPRPLPEGMPDPMPKVRATFDDGSTRSPAGSTNPNAPDMPSPSPTALLAEYCSLTRRYDKAIARQFARYDDGTASRARTTTFNAQAARYAERLLFLKSELRNHNITP